jgi:hypothetical protein
LVPLHKVNAKYLTNSEEKSVYILLNIHAGKTYDPGAGPILTIGAKIEQLSKMT